MNIRKIYPTQFSPFYDGSYHILPSFYSIDGNNKRENKIKYLNQTLFESVEKKQTYIDEYGTTKFNKYNFMTAEIVLNLEARSIDGFNINYFIVEDSEDNLYGYFVKSRNCENSVRSIFTLELDIWFSYWDRVEFNDGIINFFVSRAHTDRFEIKDNKLTSKILTGGSNEFWLIDDFNTKNNSMRCYETLIASNNWDDKLNERVLTQTYKYDSSGNPIFLKSVKFDEFAFGESPITTSKGKNIFLYALSNCNDAFVERDTAKYGENDEDKLYYYTKQSGEQSSKVNNKINGTIIESGNYTYIFPFLISPILNYSLYRMMDTDSPFKNVATLTSLFYQYLINNNETAGIFPSYIPYGFFELSQQELLNVPNYSNSIESEIYLNHFSLAGNLSDNPDKYIQRRYFMTNNDTLGNGYLPLHRLDNTPYKVWYDLNINTFKYLWKDETIPTISLTDSINPLLAPQLYNQFNTTLKISMFGEDGLTVYFNYLQDKRIDMNAIYYMLPHNNTNIFQVRSGIYANDDTLDNCYVFAGDIELPTATDSYNQFLQSSSATFNTGKANAKRLQNAESTQNAMNFLTQSEMLHPLRNIFHPFKAVSNALDAGANFEGNQAVIDAQAKNTIASYNAKRSDVEATPSGTCNVPTLLSSIKVEQFKGLQLKVNHLNNFEREKNGLRYHYYGNIINRNMLINKTEIDNFFHSRVHFNYVNFENFYANVKRTIPMQVIQAMENIFKTGTTLLHFSTDVLTINNQNYENWEMSVYNVKQ